MRVAGLYIPGETGREFDGVPIYRQCRGCSAEYCGASVYCGSCQRHNERLEERYFDHIDAENAPRRTVKAPSRLAERMWPLTLLVVLGGIAYMEIDAIAAFVEWVRAGGVQ